MDVDPGRCPLDLSPSLRQDLPLARISWVVALAAAESDLAGNDRGMK